MDGLNNSVISGKCSGCAAYKEKIARLGGEKAALAAAGQKLREELAEVGDHTDMIWDGALLREWDDALSDTGKGCRYCNRPPDGPMLAGIGHGPCIIRRLRELLDPDWEPGCGYEPLALGTLGALDALEAPVEARKAGDGD